MGFIVNIWEVIKRKSKVVEQVLGLHYKSHGMMKLVVGIFIGVLEVIKRSSRMVKLMMRLHHVDLK